MNGNKMGACQRRAWCLTGIVFLFTFLSMFVPAGKAAEIRTVIRTISISSDHPYWNSEDLSWQVGEMGTSACRVNFSRLEVEDGYDFVILNSTYGETKITGNYPEGCLSEWVHGTSFTLRLVSNGYNTDYGFDAVAYEVEFLVAWESFWMVAIPAIIGVAVILIMLELYDRRASPEESVPKRGRHQKGQQTKI